MSIAKRCVSKDEAIEVEIAQIFGLRAARARSTDLVM